MSQPAPTSATTPASANALDVLHDRGFVQDVTDADGLRELFATEPVSYYVGFDPTAASLHIGHLVGIMAMAHLKRLGHRPIALAGGATGRIGDPSFRDAERELLDDAQIDANLDGIRAQLDRIIGLSDGDGVLVDNYDWIRDLTTLTFLRDVGKHFSVNQMIARDSVRKRLTEREQGISYTEFSYQLLQAYDFAVLYDREHCRLQAGGSDQWGNIVAGVDLTRRMHGADVYGLVWPLVTRSDGRKFSKSDGTAIWLDPELTSAYAYYQWFINVPDADVIRFLKLFTFLPLDEIATLEEQHTAEPGARIAHRELAREATRIVHGGDGVAAAERATSALFGDAELVDLDDEVLADAFGEAPSVSLPRKQLEEGMGLLTLMTEVGASKSNGEARRLVDQGAVRLNNVVVDDTQRIVTPRDLVGATTMVLKVGKKRYFLARFA
ncbi:MAG: tyrosine--tRNA ligase [Nitriliruptor sp.]|nr:MAG: tyrosine--tRNA ligase [Nitriliruptor sp.]